MKMRTRITLWLVVPVVLGMGVLTVLTGMNISRDVKQKVLDLTTEICKARAAEVGKWAYGYINLISRTAGDPEMVGGDIEEIKSFMLERAANLRPEQDYEFFGSAAGMSYTSMGTSNTITDRAYFKAIMGGADFFVSEGVISKSTGKACVFICVPVKGKDKQLLGMAATSVSLGTLSAIVSDIRIGDAYALLMDRLQKIIAHPNQELIMTLDMNNFEEAGFSGLGPAMEEIRNGVAGYQIYRDADGQERYMVYTPVAEIGWTMALAFPARQVTDTVRSIVTMLIVISVIILAILITMILVIVSSIVRPINILARAALRLSNGYLTIDPADADSFRRASCKKDEIGDTIRAMDTLIGSMSGIVRSIAASSLEVEKGASAISGTSQLLSQGSTEQASSAEEVSSTIEEIASTVKQSADNASTTENIARRATADARSGADSVMRSVEAMKAIAGKIGIHRGDRQADQHACPERRHRGGSSWGCGEGVHRGGQRGPQARGEEPDRRRRDRGHFGRQCAHGGGGGKEDHRVPAGCAENR